MRRSNPVRCDKRFQLRIFETFLCVLEFASWQTWPAQWLRWARVINWVTKNSFVLRCWDEPIYIEVQPTATCSRKFHRCKSNRNERVVLIVLMNFTAYFRSKLTPSLSGVIASLFTSYYAFLCSFFWNLLVSCSPRRSSKISKSNIDLLLYKTWPSLKDLLVIKRSNNRTQQDQFPEQSLSWTIFVPLMSGFGILSLVMI